MFAAITVIWMYLAGLWAVYFAMLRDAEKEGVELEMDILGGAILLFWFTAIPAITLWSIFFGDDDE